MAKEDAELSGWAEASERRDIAIARFFVALTELTRLGTTMLKAEIDKRKKD